MRRFYQPVDLRSRQEMTQYLTTHFRYPTLNSWNRSTSYACNLKITHLGLSPEVVDKLFDMIQTQEFFDAMGECKWEFAAKHNYLWQAGMNGRSGGYLVLYQGEKRPSGYKSYCTNCGQRNYRLAADGNCTCGVCGRPTRVNFSQTHMQVVTYPGRGTDDGEDFEDWSMHALRERSCRSWINWQTVWLSWRSGLQEKHRSLKRSIFFHRPARCWSRPYNRKEQIYAESWR